jgi:hypothetical protein
VTDVSKHNTKQEGEGDNRENGWVDLLVAWDSVRVDNFLEGADEGVEREMSWRWDLTSGLVSDFDSEFDIQSSILHQLTYSLQFLRAPKVSSKKLLISLATR